MEENESPKRYSGRGRNGTTINEGMEKRGRMEGKGRRENTGWNKSVR